MLSSVESTRYYVEEESCNRKRFTPTRISHLAPYLSFRVACRRDEGEKERGRPMGIARELLIHSKPVVSATINTRTPFSLRLSGLKSRTQNIHEYPLMRCVNQTDRNVQSSDRADPSLENNSHSRCSHLLLCSSVNFVIELSFSLFLSFFSTHTFSFHFSTVFRSFVVTAAKPTSSVTRNRLINLHRSLRREVTTIR